MIVMQFRLPIGYDRVPDPSRTTDDVVDIQTAQHIASHVRDANVSVYDGVGHALFWEDADRFNRELAEFASELNKTARASRPA
jgi:hypothetical protein